MNLFNVFSLSLILITGLAAKTFAQVIPPERLTDWSNPGSGPEFQPLQSVNLISFGADTTGNLPCDMAMQQAIAYLGGPGEIYLSKGQYLFNQSLNLPDSIIIRGETDTVTKKPVTKLILSPGNTHGIIISGNETNTGVIINYSLPQGEQKIYVNQPQLFNTGDFIRLKANDDSMLVNNTWAYHSTGQIFEIIQKTGDTLYLNKPLRRSYTGNFPEILKINPARQVHINCLIIERADITSTQTSNIIFNKAADCSVTGVESYLCNYAHIDLYSSTRITIEDSFFKDGHSYGSGGKAYGIMLEYATGDCFIHRNNFDHLRHSIIFQSGANGNVVAYNYSKDPYWTGTILPANSAGDLVFHGNYPYMNLLEGNVVQNIVIDNSHGINGPNNMFFRNRAELYGIFMNASPASDQQGFIGNQVVNTSSSIMGLYSLQGINHFEYGNQIKGNVLPAGTGEPVDSTLFEYDFDSFYQYVSSVPPIKNNNWQTTTPLIAAQYQSEVMNLFSTCEEIIYTGVLVDEVDQKINIFIYPNPFKGEIYFRDIDAESSEFKIFDYKGKVIFSGKITSGIINLEHLIPGIYFLILEGKKIYKFKIIKI